MKRITLICFSLLVASCFYSLAQTRFYRNQSVIYMEYTYYSEYFVEAPAKKAPKISQSINPKISKDSSDFDNELQDNKITFTADGFTYPNPVQELLYFKKINNGHKVSKVQIFDAIGNKQIEITNPESNTVNTNSLTEGVYFIRLEYGLEVITERFIKN